MALDVDWNLSGKRRADLGRYCASAVDDGSRLVCDHRDACKASCGSHDFAEGQLSHVGSAYELTDAGRALRILVVSKQTGRDHEHVTVDARSLQVDSAKPESALWFPRTQHMQGTSFALRTLLGLSAVAGDRVEFPRSAAHVFDCFALANATLCSKVGRDAKGGGTPQMYRNCDDHLRETLRILEPTVIMSQGYASKGTSPATVVAQALCIAKPKVGTPQVVGTPWGRAVFIALRHPSMSWFTIETYQDQVERACMEARRLFLSL